jgi:hypothetical protein
MGERIMLEPTFGEEVDQIESKPSMLIVTGPQGSGNHLFAKLFNLHPEVYGWDMERYWVGHHTEPFSVHWSDTSKIKEFGWTLRSDFYTTNISCPYVKNKESQIPKYEEFITEVEKYCNVVVAIIGRDRTILEHEQNRVCEAHTTPDALEQFEYLYTLNPYFVSMELVFLYRENYLRMVGMDLGFPVVEDSELINAVLSDDSNEKYIHEIDFAPLDLEIHRSSNIAS